MRRVGKAMHRTSMLFIMLRKAVLTFESVDDKLRFDHHLQKSRTLAIA